jgi:TPR repeat protein
MIQQRDLKANYIWGRYIMGISIRAFISVLLVCLFPTLALSDATQTQHDLGYKAYSEEKDHDKALRILKPLAMKGHGESQYFVAVIYYSGPAKTGPAQDFKKAKKWFKKLAENVNADPFYRGMAYDSIAGMYWFGEGVPKNFNLQLKWLKKGLKALAAHKTAHKKLMYNLGSAHNHAGGKVKAYMWFTLAEKYDLINIVAKEMNPIQIALAKKLAAEGVAKKYKGC